MPAAMSGSGLALFATPIGACGIAWRPDGLAGIQLAERAPAATLARLKRRFPDLAEADPPHSITQIAALISAALAGETADLGAVSLDWTGIGAFDAAVYREARAIPRGGTATYGELAQRVGDPGSARAVGQALGRNPWPIVVPCHRVMAAGGRTGGFSAYGGRSTKLRLLELEGALAPEALPLFAPTRA